MNISSSSGVWNACSRNTDKTGSDSDPCRSNHFINLPVSPMYPGPKTQWGRRCGGFRYRKQCNKLPKWPTSLKKIPKPPGSKRHEPNLRELCQRSFDMGARMNNNMKKIARGFRVPCPTPLIEITNLKRTDDWKREVMHPGRLTTFQDCCSPAAAYSTILHGNKLKYPFNKIRPCKRDGYSRVANYYG